MELFFASVIQNALSFFINGGFFMGILLVVSIVAGTVIVLRGAALREKSVIPPPLASEIESLQPGDDLDKLERLIARYPSSLGRVLSTLIRHLTWSRAEAVEAVQTKARHEVARLESGLIILEITTGIAPLLGLLGTLSGLVSIFTAIGNDPECSCSWYCRGSQYDDCRPRRGRPEPDHLQLFPAQNRGDGCRNGIPRGRSRREMLPIR